MNMNFGKKKKKESKDIVQLVTIAKTLSDELEHSLNDVLTKDDVKVVQVHLGQLLLSKYQTEKKEVNENV